MKGFTKLALLIGLSQPLISYAQTNGNPNNTGLTPYDNNTGSANNGIDPGTKSTAPVNGAVKLEGTVQKDTPTPVLPRHSPRYYDIKTQIVLQGMDTKNIDSKDRDKIIQLAEDAGASGTKFKGNILICTGVYFDFEIFKSSMANAFPKILLVN